MAPSRNMLLIYYLSLSSVLFHCWSLSIVCQPLSVIFHYYPLSLCISAIYYQFSIIIHCLSASVVCQYPLYAITCCLLISIVCYHQLSIIIHNLSLSSVFIHCWSSTICHHSFSVNIYCVSPSFSCQYPLSAIIIVSVIHCLSPSIDCHFALSVPIHCHRNNTGHDLNSNCLLFAIIIVS